MSAASKKPVGVSKPSLKGDKKKAAGRGASRLSEAADKTLEENSCEIAKSLLDSTLKGNVNSVRLLLELAETPPKSEETEAKPRIRSTAKKLAAEPEWNVEAIEKAAETIIE